MANQINGKTGMTMSYVELRLEQLRVAGVYWFDRLWDHLSVTGACDGRGGAEYERVLASWEAAGRPLPASDFIFAAANVGPDGVAPVLPDLRRGGNR